MNPDPIQFGSVRPTPYSQAKNRRRALIVRRHRRLLRRAKQLEKMANDPGSE